jgi:hypothetical protein
MIQYPVFGRGYYERFNIEPALAGFSATFSFSFTGLRIDPDFRK